MTKQSLMIARRKALMAEGIPQSLTELFDRASLQLRQCRHVAIDVQNSFINEKVSVLQTLAAHISGNIAPRFRQNDIPSYWVYWRNHNDKLPQNLSQLDHAAGLNALYNVSVHENDRVLPKNDLSAFSGFDAAPGNLTLTHQALKKDRAKMIFISGIFATQCVAETVKGACRLGYHVAVLTDGIDGEAYERYEFERRMMAGAPIRWQGSVEESCILLKNKIRKELESDGVLFVPSDEAIQALRKLSTPVLPAAQL